jgi:hypothetical protein
VLNLPQLTLSLFWFVLVIALAITVGALAIFLWGIWRRRRLEREIEEIRRRSIRNPHYGKDHSRPEKTAYPTVFKSSGTTIETVIIKNFKNIKELHLDFTRPSALTGRWTCIAGINGAGKSAILQALCLVLLGSEYVSELGRSRLGRMLRRTADGTLNAEVEAIVQQHGVRRRLYIPLTGSGTEEGRVDEDLLRKQSDFHEMRETWTRLRKELFVCYGASRNVSEFKDPRNESLSRTVQRQMTLFDPLTQIASVDFLLKGGRQAKPVLSILYRLLRIVLGSEGLLPQQPEGESKLRFSQHDAAMDVIDLPDGFRSTVAWLADLSASWCELPVNEKPDPDPTKIKGIVMLDEIGLHLHPSLEKSLVSQLRRALPNVQFITSTHSPLVLSSFDRSEIVMLDASSPSGARELDRQVFGFTMDDIYAWLMDTSPGSPVMEQMLKESSDPELAVYLYQSKDVNEDRAREIIAEREKQIAKLRRQRDLS